MKLWVCIDVEVDVPDSAVAGGATPEAIKEKVQEVCHQRVARIFSGWGNSVVVHASTSAPPEIRRRVS